MVSAWRAARLGLLPSGITITTVTITITMTVTIARLGLLPSGIRESHRAEEEENEGDGRGEAPHLSGRRVGAREGGGGAGGVEAREGEGEVGWRCEAGREGAGGWCVSRGYRRGLREGTGGGLFHAPAARGRSTPASLRRGVGWRRSAAARGSRGSARSPSAASSRASPRAAAGRAHAPPRAGRVGWGLWCESVCGRMRAGVNGGG